MHSHYKEIRDKLISNGKSPAQLYRVHKRLLTGKIIKSKVISGKIFLSNFKNIVIKHNVTYRTFYYLIYINNKDPRKRMLAKYFRYVN